VLLENNIKPKPELREWLFRAMPNPNRKGAAGSNKTASTDAIKNAGP
jgi:hypothetical protein